MTTQPSPEMRALTQTLRALTGTTTPDEAITKTLNTVRDTFGWAYGSFWRLDAAKDALVFGQESGDAGPDFAAVTQSASFPFGVGLAGRTWSSRRLQYAPDLGQVDDCCRAPVATAAGVKSGVCLPIFVNNELIGTLDFFSLSHLELTPTLRLALETVGTQLSACLTQLTETAIAQEGQANAEALSQVLAVISQSHTPEDCLKSVLATVKDAFGWQYGSVWRRDHEAETLRFWTESGTVDAGFAAATAAADFPKGVGLSGRTWAAEKLVFVPDLAEVHDCSRAPAARNAGVKSGVCLPLHIAGEVEATMDFFTTRAMGSISEGREAALSQVAQVTSERLSSLFEAERLAELKDWDSTLASVSGNLVQAPSEEALWQRLGEALGAFQQVTGASITDAFGMELLSTPPAEDATELGWTGATWAGMLGDSTLFRVTLAAPPKAPRRMNIAIKELVKVIDEARVRIARSETDQALQTQLGEGVASLGQSLDEQARASAEQASAVAEVTATLSELRQTSSQALSHAESLLSVSEEASRAAEEGDEVVGRTQQGMEVIRDRVETISHTISALSEHTQQIGDIISTVNEIAEQSKLLALNASIEAARAGEFGRSFSVVANEMRDLAEQSKQATRQVRQLLSDIRGATTAAVVATEDGIAKVDEGQELVQRAGAVMGTLGAAVGETERSSKQIAMASRQQGEGVSQVADAMVAIDATIRNSAQSMADIKQVAATLSEVSHSLSNSDDGMRASA